jgi:4-hydroxybenzoyl-CoA thioesterase
MRVFVLPQHIEFGDCDPAGLVFYPNYYRWFDRATHAMFGVVGYTFAQIKRDYGWLAWPLIESGAAFKSPGIAGDDVEIHSSVAQWSSRTFKLSHRVLRDGQLLVDGWELRFLGEPVPGDPHKLRAAVIPDEMKRRFD